MHSDAQRLRLLRSAREEKEERGRCGQASEAGDEILHFVFTDTWQVARRTDALLQKLEEDTCPCITSNKHDTYTCQPKATPPRSRLSSALPAPCPCVHPRQDNKRGSRARAGPRLALRSVYVKGSCWPVLTSCNDERLLLSTRRSATRLLA